MSEQPGPDETTLVQLLRADLPPTRDPLFRIDVLKRRERQRFRRELVVVLTLSPVAALRSVASSLLARVTRTLSRAFVD